MTTDTTTDQELERLLIAYAGAAYHFSEDEIAKARDAVLAHVAARYVRRDDPRYRILDRANERMVGYAAARGILPWRPGDELPEERIRRLRDAADGNGENADVP